MSAESEALRLLRGVQNFADDMRAQGIHVGLGRAARCVVDDEPWPCEHERQRQSSAASSSGGQRPKDRSASADG